MLATTCLAGVLVFWSTQQSTNWQAQLQHSLNKRRAAVWHACRMRGCSRTVRPGLGTTGRLWWCWRTSQRWRWIPQSMRCSSEGRGGGLGRGTGAAGRVVRADAGWQMPRTDPLWHMPAPLCRDRGLKLEVHTREGNPFKMSDLRKVCTAPSRTACPSRLALRVMVHGDTVQPHNH